MHIFLIILMYTYTKLNNLLRTYNYLCFTIRMHTVYKNKNNKNISEKLSVSYVMICCCTYKRPEKLERLLNNLSNINYQKNIKTEILVVDNDKEKSAEKVVSKFSQRLCIHYVSEKQKGLSNARNAALRESMNYGASHIAFIDDDEIADINWLVNHIEFYQKFEDIYISSGPTYKRFENNYPSYIINNTVFATHSSKKLGDYKKTCASGNVFFPLNIIKDSNTYFSKDFNFSGSEDTDFFSRLSKNGYIIGWNYNAVNFELINDERANIKWILNRAFHNGYSVSLTRFLNQKNFYKRLFYIIEKIFTLLMNFIIIIFSIPFGITKFLNSVTRFVKNFGKFLGAILLERRSYYGE